MANRVNHNFTQIQESCDSLNEWEFSHDFQAIINEVIIHAYIAFEYMLLSTQF